MPLYFFDLLTAGDLFPDEEGTELPSMDEVQNEAAYALADMLRDQVRATMGNPTARDLMIIVRDTGGPVLEASIHLKSLAFSERSSPAVSIIPGAGNRAAQVVAA